jgi:hypothetical protein
MHKHIKIIDSNFIIIFLPWDKFRAFDQNKGNSVSGAFLQSWGFLEYWSDGILEF